MTAVVRLRIKQTNLPILIGDLLLSSPDYTPENFTVPTHDESLHFPIGSGLVASDLRQKLAIISEDLIVGWSGGAYDARLVIKDLMEQNQQRPFTSDSLGSYFRQTEESIRTKNLSLIGFFKDSSGMGAFGINCDNRVSTELFGEAALLGTGVKDLRYFLENVNMLPVPVDKRGSPLTQSVLIALGMSGTLLSSEIASGSSIKNLFGGGYEIATVVDGSFRKIEDITYIFWIVATDGGHVQIKFPHRALKVSYVRDTLVIRVDSMTPLPGGTGVETKPPTCYVVPPVYRHVEFEELEPFVPSSIKSKFICNYFLFKDQAGKETVLAGCEYVADRESSSIRFIEENGWQLRQLATNEAYFDQIADYIRQHYRS